METQLILILIKGIIILSFNRMHISLTEIHNSWKMIATIEETNLSE